MLSFLKKPCSEIEKALSSDKRIVLLCDDPDSIGAACIILFLMMNNKMSYAAASGVVKDRRITT